MRTLYVAQFGSLFSAWWDTAPPQMEAFKKPPRFRAPDVYHDHVVGSLKEILETLSTGRVLPPRNTYALETVSAEWARVGLTTAEAVTPLTGGAS